MRKFNPGDKAFIIESSIFVKEVEIVSGSGIDYDGINNVMYSYAGNYRGQLGQGDLAAYRYLWG